MNPARTILAAAIQRLALRGPLYSVSILALLAAIAVACGGGGGAGSPPVLGSGQGGDGGTGSSGGGVVPNTPAAEAILDLTAATGPTPGVVVLRFTAPQTGSLGSVAAYEVRAQVQHLTSANAAFAPVVPQSHTPGAPGGAETLTLGGLEPGQTLQFTVRALHANGTGPFSHGAGARVKDTAPPTAPGNAILLSGPDTLTSDGATYRLTQDITTSGTAFRITGRGIVLDLGGYTVTYGTGGGVAHGVEVRAPDSSGTTTVMNGRVRQSAANSATYSHGVDVGGGHTHRISRLEITTQGPGAFGVYASGNPSGTVRIDHCTVNCNVTSVPNRHYPGVAAIYCERVPNAIEIDHNLITASPQWGVKIEGRDGNVPCLVHHNQIVGTKARVANGYMIGVYRPKCDVFENALVGESRGIHIDGAPDDGLFGHDAHVHDNLVVAQDQPNAEFNPHWCHGIKIEQPDSASIHHNRVRVVADAQHAESRALDIDVETGGDVEIYSNRIDGISSHGPFKGNALYWTGGSIGVPNRLQLVHNVFRATDVLVNRSWHTDTGGPFRENVWLRDTSKGGGNPVIFEHWGNENGEATPGHRFLDPLASGVDTEAVNEWANPGAYTSTREATFTVVVMNGGAPVGGASVLVRDRQNTTVLSETTDGEGTAEGLVVLSRITVGPSVDTRGPFTVIVNRAGVGSFTGPVAIDGTRTLVVDLSTETAELDTDAPTAPGGVYAVPLSASRVVVRWAAPSAADRVVRFLVRRGGEIDAVTDRLECVLSGLDPAMTHQITVQALDAGGNFSPVSTQIAVTTPADDRGP